MVKVLAAIALTMAAASAQRDAVVVYDRALTDAYQLRVTTTRNGPKPADGGTLRLVLQARGAAPHIWELLSQRIRDDQIFTVERATARVVVLSWISEPYGSERGHTKLFLDLANKRIEKRVDYPEMLDVVFPSDRDAVTALSVTLDDVDTLRPAFRENGWTAQDIGVQETVESFQQVGDRMWFGKSFYDAEGDTGIGALGWLDQAGIYTFLKIPALVPWSVSALLVEPPGVWAGLTHRGEEIGRAHV